SAILPKSFKKLLLAMKLTSIFLLLAFIQVSAKSDAQQVTFSEGNITLEKAFKVIHQQTKYNFLCTKKQLKESNKIKIDLNTLSLTEALNQIFKNQPFTYDIYNNTIVVKKVDNK